MIENNPNANASTYPNGTIVINTGLLSTLHTEDELVACLAHEVAHFVLDHHIININTEIKRQKAAAAAAAFATVVAAVAEGAATYYSNGYYMPGAVTAATAIGATAIANEIVTSLGMEYTQQQEFEADRYALQVVKFLGYDTTALASALTRLEHIMINERSNSMYLSSESHPALVDRINAAGKANLKRDINYERMVSFAITNSAYTKMDYRRFREAMVGVSQNIENNVATADDYLIKANCLLALKNDVSSNIEVLNLINKAKELQPNNINIHKAEILAELRLNNLASACEKLNTYSSYLDIMDEELPMIKNEELWKVRYYFTMHEREWVEKMLIKLKSMQS
jgi:predicted Zn-dependent protease